jgi:6-pyruvoyltetrahydropterin/6-carboxytetrahydropterin synthase
MYRVTKDIHFCYGHRLVNHKGKCRNLHGHNATAVIKLESETLDDMGMVVDFSDIGDYVKLWINEKIDHKMLMFKEDPFLPAVESAGEPVFIMDCNPTAENIARLIFDYVEQGGFPVVEVALHETDSALASYSKER